METPVKNILITGYPGVGKTTLLRRLAVALQNFHPVGFYTAEIREGGVRKGFELISLDGKRGLLSHVDIRSACRVGKYGVDVTGFEQFLEKIDFRNPAAQLLVIDEIGKMECFAKRFRKLIMELLESDKVLVATIARKGDRWIETIKQRADIRLWEITSTNRDRLLETLLPLIQNVLS